MQAALGPFLLAEPSDVESPLPYSGFVVNILFPNEAVRLPLYRRQPQKHPMGGIFDLFFRSSDMAACAAGEVQFSYQREIDYISIDGEEYYSLNRVMYALYKEWTMAVTPKGFFSDLCACVECGYILPESDAEFDGVLAPNLLSHGYVIYSVHMYEQRLDVEIHFTPIAAVGEPLIRRGVPAAAICFRPREGKLGKAVLEKWSDERFYTLMGEEFSQLAPRNKSECFSRKGLELLLQRVTWTPLTAMSAAEAKQARHLLIDRLAAQGCPVSEIVRELKHADLYSINTSEHQIRRTLLRSYPELGDL